MKVYILVYEPYHENSEIHGVYATETEGLQALRDAPQRSPEPHWDNSDTWDLQEWDTETIEKTRHWVQENPHEPITQDWPKGRIPKKLGWRIEEQVP